MAWWLHAGVVISWHKILPKYIHRSNTISCGLDSVADVGRHLQLRTALGGIDINKIILLNCRLIALFTGLLDLLIKQISLRKAMLFVLVIDSG